jgi:hypothetical protein
MISEVVLSDIGLTFKYCGWVKTEERLCMIRQI